MQSPVSTISHKTVDTIILQRYNSTRICISTGIGSNRSEPMPRMQQILTRQVNILLKDKVLNILEAQKGNVVTGGSLAKVLNVSRTSIWKAVHSLQADGNEIVPVPNIGYKLLPTNDTLSMQSITDKLSTRYIGRSMVLLPSVHSTNQYLKELDTTGHENGYVVVANEQVRGRGRRSRAFLSAKGEGVYFSILLKLSGMQLDIQLFTICAAVAVSKAVEAVCGRAASIKWVNDVYLGEKKICGILTEAVLSGELQELDTVIIGIGINTGSVPDELKEIATSIGQETGVYGIRNTLIAEVLNQFEAVYLDYTERNKKADILSYYESRLFIIGRRVTVSNFRDAYAATVLGIDDAGALIVEKEDGGVTHITSGEIRL